LRKKKRILWGVFLFFTLVYVLIFFLGRSNPALQLIGGLSFFGIFISSLIMVFGNGGQRKR